MLTTITKTEQEEPLFMNIDNLKSNITNNISTKKKVEPKKEKPIPQYDKYKFLFWEFETPIIWYSAISIILFHMTFVYGALTINYYENRYILLFHFLVVGPLSGLGITAGAHRYFTHRSFKAKRPLKIFLLMCYCIAGQNRLTHWVQDHRVHHKFSETDADPHNSNRGFFFSHVGWLMMRKHPEVIRKGRTIDISDITEDPDIQFVERNWVVLKSFFCFILPFLIPYYVFGQSAYYSFFINAVGRYCASLNSTWSVNSFAHIFGNHPYDKNICPAENVAVSFFAMGEGYHNYHHTFPWDYRTAELGSKLNVTTLWLNFFHKIGWAYEMKAPSNELIKKVTESHGDGTHYKWGHEISLNGLNESDLAKEKTP